MESKDKEARTKKDGVYLSNFVATAVAFFILVLAFAAGFFAKGYFAGSPLTANPTAGAVVPPVTAKPKTASEIYNLLPKLSDADHVKGDSNANIVLVEYSDFQCPFCARFHPTVKDFLAKNPDVAYVFRHLPLDFHQFALERAKASECAVKLAGPEAFWAFSDLAFGATDLNAVDLQQVGTQLGLNGAAFAECIKSTEFDKKIADMSSGGKTFLSAVSDSGSYGTPGAVIINHTKKVGEKFGGAVPLSDLEAGYKKVK
jgi:protein-disulfide isomerase